MSNIPVEILPASEKVERPETMGDEASDVLSARASAAAAAIATVLKQFQCHMEPQLVIRGTKMISAVIIVPNPPASRGGEVSR